MKVPLETFHLHGQTTRFCRQTRNLEMLYLSPWLLLRIEGLFSKPMQVLGKPVWREKTRLTSPEVRVAETSKAWRDLGRPLFSLDLPVDLARAATERATKSRGRLVSPEWIWIKLLIHAGKNDWHMMCRELREISLTVLFGQSSWRHQFEFSTTEFRAKQVWKVL